MASETAVTFQEIGKPHAGQRLDNFLLTRLKGVPKSRIYRIIRKGEVRVNKKRVRPEYKLQEEDLVRIPPIRVADRSKPMPPGKELQDVLQEAVLYEDDYLLIVNKPAGIAVHAGTGVKTGLIESLRFMKPELERLELVHRLDKGTSGCLLIARSASALKKLSSQFKEGQVTKIYHALVEGSGLPISPKSAQRWSDSQHRGEKGLLTYPRQERPHARILPFWSILTLSPWLRQNP